MFSGYVAAPVMTGMGAVSRVLVIITPVFFSPRQVTRRLQRLKANLYNPLRFPSTIGECTSLP